MSDTFENLKRLTLQAYGFKGKYDAHIDAYRQWEREWYGPEGKGPSNLGSGRCLHDELSEFYKKCASQAFVEGEHNFGGEFSATAWRLVNDTNLMGRFPRLPAVNVEFVLKDDKPQAHRLTYRQSPYPLEAT